LGFITDIGLIKSETSITASIFEKLFPDFNNIIYKSPNNYLSICWKAYTDNYPNENVGTNGKYFELCIATLLIKEKILPFYVQAKVAFVPNVEYDFILYSKEVGPICISAKTSLRERYKQADLEAIALKYVHRKSKSYLLTLNEKESDNIKIKIKNGDVIGLDDSIHVLSDELNLFIESLRYYSFCIAPTVDVVRSEVIITKEKINSAFNKGNNFTK